MDRISELENYFAKKAAEYRSKRLNGDFKDCIFETVPIYTIAPTKPNLNDLELLHELCKSKSLYFALSIADIDKESEKIIMKISLT